MVYLIYMYKKYILWISLCVLFVWSTRAASRSLPGISIITRAQRWADESWRYTDTSKTERDAIRQEQLDAELSQLMETDVDAFLNRQQQIYEGQMATDYLITNTPTEQVVDEYRESSSGNYLKRPESIHKNKSKIIIHHTADDYSALLTWGKDAVIKQIQDIYKYHTFTKGRWDIGYNFLIDPDGNIYEWRAWWAGTVWAHVSRNNTPSLGVSLMGNFNIQEPTDKQLKSLVSLTTALAKKYKINPLAKTNYYKKSSDVPYIQAYENYRVAGHSDAWVTSCPGTNLYELLPDIRQQVSKNLITYSLTVYRPPVAPVINRWVIVDGRYYVEWSSATIALPIRWSSVSSCTTADTGFTINSCRLSNDTLLMSVTRKWWGWLKTVTATTSSGSKLFSFYLIRKDDFWAIAKPLKDDYQTRKWITASSQSINKITSKISLSDIKTLMQTPLNILLYELSTSYPRFEISCDGGCAIQADDQIYTGATPVVETSNGFIYLTLPNFENALAVSNLEISSSNWGLVRVTNYMRKSYGGTSWNSFRWSLIRKKDTIKKLPSGEFVQQAIVTNKTSFDNYMKGIAETSDSENVEKQKLVLLLAKMYTLFYINGQNSHPSIPAGASYQAIDNPDMFQKYVWAWREKTSKMSATLLDAIKNTVIMYDGYVPILPYFSCSAGFTRSAKEKRWWNDTPYLQSRLDFGACFDFNGHGVGLSGKWAQFLAEKWRTMEQIAQYYYPGVTFATLN